MVRQRCNDVMTCYAVTRAMFHVWSQIVTNPDRWRARRAQVTCADTHILWVKPQRANPCSPFLKTSLFFNFPAQFIWQVNISDYLSAVSWLLCRYIENVIDPVPLTLPLSSAHTLIIVHTKSAQTASPDRHSTPVATLTELCVRQCGVELGLSAKTALMLFNEPPQTYIKLKYKVSVDGIWYSAVPVRQTSHVLFWCRGVRQNCANFEN